MNINEDFYDGHTPRERILSVRVEDKFKFTSKIILDYLELRKGKASKVKEIADATGFDRNTVSKHLEYLVATRQVYQISESGEKAYHKNGRIVHYHNMDNRAFSNKLYTFYKLQDLDGGTSIYVQEKEVGKLKSVSVRGGIVVKEKDFKRFIDELKSFSQEIQEDTRKSDGGKD